MPRWRKSICNAIAYYPFGTTPSPRIAWTKPTSGKRELILARVLTIAYRILIVPVRARNINEPLSEYGQERTAVFDRTGGKRIAPETPTNFDPVIAIIEHDPCIIAVYARGSALRDALQARQRHRSRLASEAGRIVEGTKKSII
jgi:hypothetical protein